MKGRGRRNPEKLADELLEKYALEPYEVDLISLLKNEGIDLYRAELPADVSGILQVEGGKYTVFIQNSHNSHRQRFSIAHELGHFILHNPKSTHIDRKSFFRGPKAAEGLHNEEIEANRFAAALLMPRNWVYKAIDEFVDEFGEDLIDTDEDIISLLADKFNVSPSAMSFRLQNIGIFRSFSA
ncbi:ImmA/IrrE family metallo-endopeptidase [Leptospira koniambonensis]|uniref:ImmA/IrrE family metallo-endopeptidase n=1 Tax=Leptospira koniambonensis TaxID=2484950 RepID=UPI003EB85486